MKDKNNEFEYVYEDFKLARKKSKKEIEIEEKKRELKKKLKSNRKNKKSIGITIFLIFIACIISVLILNWDRLTLPKNSVMVTIKDQNGDSINGLIVRADSNKDYFAIIYEKDSGPTVVNSNLKPGEYTLRFIAVPDGYKCPKIDDTFILNSGDRVKLNYKCEKLN